MERKRNQAADQALLEKTIETGWRRMARNPKSREAHAVAIQNALLAVLDPDVEVRLTYGTFEEMVAASSTALSVLRGAERDGVTIMPTVASVPAGRNAITIELSNGSALVFRMKVRP